MRKNIYQTLAVVLVGTFVSLSLGATEKKEASDQIDQAIDAPEAAPKNKEVDLRKHKSSPIDSDRSFDAKDNKSETKCRMKFTFSSWSVLYKSGKGVGDITCDNGQRSDVKIRVHGGGVTFGKSRIDDGSGTFSKVKDISELYGAYAAAEAHAGAIGSAAVQAMTKGPVSLALSGTGKGIDFGIAFGQFKISPR